MLSPKSPKIRLEHIIFEIEGISALPAGVTASEVIENYGYLRAVERALQIISEASKELPKELLENEPGIPWKQIIGIGNFLRHEYYRINTTDIQSILEVHLPKLHLAALRLMERMSVDDGK